MVQMWAEQRLTRALTHQSFISETLQEIEPNKLNLFQHVEEFPTDHSCLLSKGAHLCSERLFSKIPLRLRSEWLGQKPLSLQHLLIVALLRTDQFFEMLTDSTLRLKFTSHTVGWFWSGGRGRMFNHRPEGHGYSFLSLRQYVFFTFVKDWYGENETFETKKLKGTNLTEYPWLG